MKNHYSSDQNIDEKIELITINRALRSELREKKYALISAKEFSIDLELADDWQNLCASWNQLETDHYLKDGACFRLRRYGLFYLLPSTGELLHLPPAPYFQSAGINTYAGGIKRHFAPLSDSTQDNNFLHALIKFNFRQFPVDDQKASQAWEVDVHQFRIVATHDQQGEPTPEGIHHDGDDFNAIYLIQRQNATGGKNSVYDNQRNLLASSTLLTPMDSVLVWDPHVMHGVTPIHPKKLGEPGIRDVLVIGYNYCPNLKRPA